MHKSFIALCTVGLCTFGAVSASAATPVLNGTVGPGYTVTLTQHGKTVKTLKAGKYTFVTNDKSSAHNFAIEGLVLIRTSRPLASWVRSRRP